MVTCGTTLRKSSIVPKSQEFGRVMFYRMQVLGCTREGIFVTCRYQDLVANLPRNLRPACLRTDELADSIPWYGFSIFTFHVGQASVRGCGCLSHQLSLGDLAPCHQEKLLFPISKHKHHHTCGSTQTSKELGFQHPGSESPLWNMGFRSGVVIFGDIK